MHFNNINYLVGCSCDCLGHTIIAHQKIKCVWRLFTKGKVNVMYFI